MFKAKTQDVYATPNGVMRDEHLGGLSIRVYMALACVDQTEQNNGGLVEISRKRLKQLSRTCDRTLKIAVNELTARGWIRIVSGKESGVKNTYKVNYKREVL